MAVPAPLPRLTSRQHARVRECRDLARGPSRDGRVLLDGAHLVVDALAAGIALDFVLATREALDAEPRLAMASPSAGLNEIFEVSPAVLDAASPARTPSGVVAVARWEPVPVEAIFDTSPALVVAIDGVQDPGNAGGIIRSADALGATGVIVSGASADPGHWKTLRGSMGSMFRISVARGDVGDAISDARKRRIAIMAAVPRDGRDPSEIEFEKATLLIVGGEGAGLDAEVIDAADMLVSVPMREGVESLNVGVAAALLLDAARRRRALSRQP